MFNFIQMFAEEASTGVSTEGVTESVSTESAVPNAEVQTEAPRKTLRELIDSDEDYKKEYQTMQTAHMRRRLKDHSELEEKVKHYESFAPTLAQYYGLDVADLEGIANAVKGDDAYFKKSAIANNSSAKDGRMKFNLSEENRRMNAQLESINAEKTKNETVSRWANETETAKQIYPSLNFESEMENKDFARLVMNGVPVQFAYEVIHREELGAAMVQYGRAKAAESIAQDIAANKARPAEGGLSGNATPKTEVRPRDFTESEREKIRQRVRRGEKVTF